MRQFQTELEKNMNFKNSLVFAAHADDEIIGLGGTIAKLSALGSRVVLVVFTTGETAYSDIKLKNKIGLIRDEENKKSMKILGIKEKINLGLPCQGVENTKEIYQECVRIIRKFKPDVIFTHWNKDKHRDHRAISVITEEARWKATENVLVDLGKPWYTQYMFFYEILELFTFPSLVVDITDTFDKKILAMKTQKSQFSVLPGILNYIEGLAKTRGYMCGTKYAEAFLESNFIPKKM